MQSIDLTVTEAAKALAVGRIGALEYADALLARAERCASLNAFILIEPDRVRQQARQADARRARGDTLGPLHGVPIGFKDNMDTAGVPTTGGSPGLKRNLPKRNSKVVQQLVDAGAIMFGKANLHELAYGITSNNGGFGAVRNPWDPNRIPGGSSGGSGASVAARIVPASIGTDTGGSVRVPAALCGVVGLRPTTGPWSAEGVVPISHTRDTPGPLARTVADCALLHQIVAGGALATAAVLKGIRIGVPRAEFWQDLDPQTEQLCEAALQRLRDAGAVLIEADATDVMALDAAAGFPIALYETVVELNDYLRAHDSPLDFAGLAAQCASPDVRGLLTSLTGAMAIPEAAYRKAVDVDRPALQAAYRRYFESQRVEAMIFPATPLPAAKIGEDETVMHNGRAVPTFQTFIRNSAPSSVAGIPGLSLPIGLSAQRLPIGIELDAPAGADQRLLAIGMAIEALFEPLPNPI